MTRFNTELGVGKGCEGWDIAEGEGDVGFAAIGGELSFGRCGGAVCTTGK